MSRSLLMTDRDRVILDALGLKVRLFSQRQLADHFWAGSLANARRRMKWLAANGLVIRFEVQVRILVAPVTPLVVWKPGDPAPDFGAVAHQCQQRLKRRPLQSCVVWIASEKTAQMFGGTGRGDLKNPIQATHDLGVSAVWLRTRETNVDFAQAWKGEDSMAQTRRGQKRPDAFIVDHGIVTWVIEFGGGYDADRVMAFHEDCAERSLQYQLW